MLFNHRIGKREQLIWNIEADCLRRLGVDDQLELGRLFNRQIGRFCPSCYLINVFGQLSRYGGKVRSIGQQAARICKLTESGN